MSADRKMLTIEDLAYRADQVLLLREKMDQMFPSIVKTDVGHLKLAIMAAIHDVYIEGYAKGTHDASCERVDSSD